jgi:23S rRNA (cytosine1962-C5)-methyltransferase
MHTVRLTAGKDRAILAHHHWIFSGAFESLPLEVPNGSLVKVESARGELLGQAYINRNSNITGRMIAFSDKPITEVLRQKIRAAVRLRNSLFDPNLTTAYRIINAEGDELPGLIIDRYADVLVLQITTLGMEKLKPVMLSILTEMLPSFSILERSISPVRKTEGLADFEGWMRGKPRPQLEIVENGLKFAINFEHTQKTGFFLDQREMRSLVRQYAKDRHVLNCFAFSGGFSIAALAGGAKQAISVDISVPACQLATQNAELNGFSAQQHHATADDVFHYLQELRAAHDFVILDPPAFAKKKSDVPNAIRGYRDLNRLAISKLPPNSFLLTCSCSYHIDPTLFQKIIFQAALETGRKVQILERHRLASDHPINIYHPEADYLKSLFLAVE